MQTPLYLVVTPNGKIMKLAGSRKVSICLEFTLEFGGVVEDAKLSYGPTATYKGFRPF